MCISSSLFDPRFQAQQKNRVSATPHSLILKAQRRLEQRLADLKEPCPHIFSCFELQTAHDLPAELSRIYDALPQNGLFLGVIAGGKTLCELRECLMKAENELTGGASPRVAPMIDLLALSLLLPEAGFSHTAGDQESFTFIYPDIFALMHDLRRTGFTNSLTARSRKFAPRALFNKTNDLYKTRYPASQGGITVTLDLLYMHGWKEKA